MTEARKNGSATLDSPVDMPLSAFVSSTSASAMEPHCHDEKVKSDTNKVAKNKLIFATVLCLAFMIAELVGGTLANSLAIFNDALHLLTDLVSFGVSYGALVISTRPATKTLSFGWHRIEILGALLSVLLMWLMTAVLVYLAIDRIVSGDYEIDPSIMLITAGIGIAINLVMGLTLHNTGHGHSHGGLSHNHSHGGGGHGHGGEGSDHGHSHDDKLPLERKKREDSECENHHESDIETSYQNHSHEGEEAGDDPEAKNDLNVRAAVVHVLGDLIQSVGVTVAALIIFFKPEWKIVDPITTFAFSVLVLITTFYVLRDAFNVLMEGVPRDMNFNEVKEALESIEGVKGVHNLRIWSLTITRVVLSCHIAAEVDPNDFPVILERCQLELKKHNIFESVIQLEKWVSLMDSCRDCIGPEK